MPKWGTLMIYKTKEFASQIKKESLSNDDLIQACNEMDCGLFDADLGGGLYKKRISAGNKGKRGGYRTVIGAVIGDRYFFLYAFAKNDKANVSSKEKLALKELAKLFLEFEPIRLNRLVKSGELIEVGKI